MLVLHDATVGYRKQVLLEHAGFALERGCVMGLAAPNGCGKTTLLQTLSGDCHHLVDGWIDADGVSPSSGAEFGRLVYYAPSDESLFYPRMSVKFHLEAVKECWNSKSDINAVAEETGVSEFMEKPINTLSQGMLHQASLAMARMSNCSYFLLDEPLNALDPLRSEDAAKTIRSMADGGAGVLLVSHQPEEMDRICDAFLFIRDGKLWEIPKTDACRSLFHSWYDA